MKRFPDTSEPAGWRRAGVHLNPALAYVLAVWGTHAVLRFFQIFRDDPYGTPFVGKPDWYIFHALAMDWQWTLAGSLPFLAAAALGGFLARPLWGRLALVALAAFQSGVLLLTVVDQEVMRFLGMHLDPSFLGTYGNSASYREVLRFLAADRSVPYLPLALLLLCVPFSFLLAWALRKLEWARRPELRLKVPVAFALAALAGHLYLHVVWPGGFRMMKLQPILDVAAKGMARRPASREAPESMAAKAAAFQRQWLLEQGDDAWVFPDPEYPFYREPLDSACAQGLEDPRCREDGDGDGFPVSADCDDAAAAIRPGAEDRPRNGVDENCDGVDALPPNIVLIILESHRALNVGHLKPHGALAGATPFLDSLAARGHAWTRFSASGLPTINALMATHLSVLQHPTRYLSNEFTTLRHRAFPQVLASHGYKTFFFSAADPSWDGQVPWLRQWYQGFDYHRSRETDRAMFRHMARWMLDSLDGSRPFCVAAVTKTNHYPFNPEPGVRRLPPDATLQEKMLATMEYTDDCLREFFATVRASPWHANTLYVVMADHGFPLNEHGSSALGHGLYVESLWVPFVIAGEHPRLGAPRFRHEPASQIDIGPTLMDLAGIRDANHWMGHSLLRPSSGVHSLSYMVKGEQGTLDYGEFRVHGPLGDIPRDGGPEVFHSREDRLGRRNLFPQDRGVYDSLMPFLREVASLNTRLLETDALWPEKAGQAVAGPASFPDSSP